MITPIYYKDLGHKNYGWLNAHYHFSFSDYYNPNRMGFGDIKVINDDIIQPQSGFPLHGHQDMEIITFIRSGAITHKDTLGNQGVTKAGDIQIMGAGTGIRHSEYNLTEDITHLYQIWITPRIRHEKPYWDSIVFAHHSTDKTLPLLISGNQNAPLKMNADADIYGGFIKKDTAIQHDIPQHYGAYILVSKGDITINALALTQGDALEVTDETIIIIKTYNDDAEIVIIHTRI